MTRYSNTTCDEDSNTTCEEDCFGGGDDDSEGGWRDRSGHHSVPTKDACVLKEVNDTQGINSGGSSNDNIMASDYNTPQSHAINDGISVIRNSVIDGVLETSLRVTLYYNLVCIRVCGFYK